MGAWGPGPFENDAAADWLDTLNLSALSDGVGGALHGTLGDIDDSDVASVAIAASALVAAVDGHPDDAFLPGMELALQSHRDSLLQLVPAARTAVMVIRNGSGLAELWAESDAAQEWRAALDDLEARLAAIARD